MVFPADARRKLSLYKPPIRVGRRKDAGRHRDGDMWVIGVWPSDRSEHALLAGERATDRAKKKIRDPSNFGIKDIEYSRKWTVREGDLVVQLMHKEGKNFFESPARVGAIEPYVGNRQASMQVVALEYRKRVRSRPAESLLSVIAKSGRSLRETDGFYKVRNASLRRALLATWPDVSEWPG